MDQGPVSLRPILYTAYYLGLHHGHIYHLLSDHEQAEHNNAIHDPFDKIFEVTYKIKLDSCHSSVYPSRACSQLHSIFIGAPFPWFSLLLWPCFIQSI